MNDTSVKTSRSSVSLAVYRELIKELQASQERIEALDTQNQELVRENEQLRQALATSPAELQGDRGKVSPPAPTSGGEKPDRIHYSVATGEKSVNSTEPAKGSKPKISGLFLGTAVFLLVVTCGLATFWSVRSLVKR